MSVNSPSSFQARVVSGVFLQLLPYRKPTLSRTMMLTRKSTVFVYLLEVGCKEERKDMLYLMMHSTHFIYVYMASNIVEDHSDSERGNSLRPHWLLFPISRKGSFTCIISQMDSTYHSLCYTSHGALARTRDSSMGTPLRIDPMIHRTIMTISKSFYHRAISRS